MGFEIKKEEPKDKVITMGQADQEVEYYLPPGATEPVRREKPPVETNEPSGEVEKMGDKDIDKAGAKTLREDKPGEQGAVGSHGKNAPAQEKTPKSGQKSAPPKK